MIDSYVRREDLRSRRRCIVVVRVNLRAHTIFEPQNFPRVGGGNSSLN
jgi:hypothetical protein